MIEILLDNKDGKIWDVSELISEVTWKTTRTAKPASAEVTLIKGGLFQSNAFHIETGAILRIREDDRPLFYGYVFVVENGKAETLKLTAYDQLRYWTSNDTYVFNNATATEVIRRIAGDTGTALGVLEDTGYAIPTMVEDNQKLLDIACKVLESTLVATGSIYMLYDDFGALSLRKVDSLTLPFMLGDESLMYDYGYKRSIDGETYNRIKLVMDNKETKRREVFIGQDSQSIGKWGRLQLYRKLDERMKPDQVKTLLDQLLARHNQEERKLSLDALGDSRVRAGYYLWVFLENFGLKQPFLVEECSHTFSGGEHTMSLEVKVV